MSLYVAEYKLNGNSILRGKVEQNSASDLEGTQSYKRKKEMVLKRLLQKSFLRYWILLNWLRIGSSDGLM